ncbi:MAG: KH domain RNA binding protein YlqC [Ktedonobacterales bacterium]|jgi:predicted RNA-binding protein YlqC (UPF0109 family)|nr:MAG: KH domain RNA binding protein YlqC [Ktedonobacterales bacterium]
MQGLIEFLARNLVDTPDAVAVRQLRDDRYATILRLDVDNDDLGKVIGRQGRVAKAMRTLMRASATLQGKRHIGLEIHEDMRQEQQPDQDQDQEAYQEPHDEAPAPEQSPEA